MRWAAAAALPPRLRSMRQFAQQEIILPSGPEEGCRFRLDPQPLVGLWLDEVDSGRWQRFAITAPSQSGKTLLGSLIPLCYHLFELAERVIFGVPDMDMAADKWRDDILPIIERTRYRDLLPRAGGGSRGGKIHALKFRNGAVLRFMSAGGGDKSRAGYTSRVLVVTEVDGFDTISDTSREADKVKQLEARTRRYGARRRIYLECTVSTAEGRIWREYEQGTASRIALPCPLCRAWVSPEREHLLGWQDAESPQQARQNAHFCCPGCGGAWTDQQRAEANAAAKLVHRGQELTPEGILVGNPPPVETFGFRWSAVNNLFATAGDVAVDQWRAAREPNEDNAEREQRQFVWCLPYDPARWDDTPLDPQAVRARTDVWRKGFVPADTEHLTVAIDLGKRVAWWMAVAWRPGASGHVLDYGSLEVRSDDLGVEAALLAALRDFREELLATGFPAPDGRMRQADRVLIDAGYHPEVVYQFVRESGPRLMPIVGRGAGQQYAARYHRPKRSGGQVQLVSEGFHITAMPRDGVFLLEADADHWKSWLHQRLATPLGKPGAMTLYTSTDRNEHISLSKHLTAERQIEEFIAGKGTVTKWVRASRSNHWFDCAYYNAVAGHLCGARLLPQPKTQTKGPPQRRAGLTMPDGRPYLVTERD